MKIFSKYFKYFKQLTIFQKVIFTHLLSIFVLVFFICFFSYYIIKNFYYENVFDSLKKINLTCQDEIQDFFNKQKKFSHSPLEKKLLHIAKKNDIRLTLIQQDGVVIFDSEKDFHKMENHSNRFEIQQLLFSSEQFSNRSSKKTARSIRYSNTLNKEMLYFANKIIFKESKEIKKEKIIILRSSQYLKKINILFFKLFVNIALSILIIFLIIVLISFLFVRSISKPFAELILFSKKVSKGDFNAKIQLVPTNEFKKNEFQKLIFYFNEMNDKISNLFQKNVRQKKKLQTIIDSLPECLLVISQQGEILNHNQSFQKNFNLQKKKIIGKYYWELFEEEKNKIQFTQFIELIDFFLTNTKKKENKLNEKYKKINKEKKFRKKFSLNGKYYSVENISYRTKELMILFYDFSYQKKADQMKKDFVTNITHELKTPLTSIKGYLELLKEKFSEQKKQRNLQENLQQTDDLAAKFNYLQIIEKNTDRIDNLVNDLMKLWTLENQNFQLKKSIFNLSDMIEKVISLFQNQLEKEKFKIFHQTKESKILIYADVTRIEQVLVNLIENSIKYSKEKDKKIMISCEKEIDKIILFFADNGIGLEKKNHTRIFERFFLVDKSRFKEKGGNGIGLAIVKHIIQLHKGKIKVKGEINKGLEFKITLPQKKIY